MKAAKLSIGEKKIMIMNSVEATVLSTIKIMFFLTKVAWKPNNVTRSLSLEKQKRSSITI